MKQFLLYFSLCVATLSSCDKTERQPAQESTKGNLTTYQWEEWSDLFIDGFEYNHVMNLGDTTDIYPLCIISKTHRTFKIGVTAELLQGSGEIISSGKRPDFSCIYIPKTSGEHQLRVQNSVNTRLSKIIKITVK